jgi:hypothetical protein
MNTPDPESNHGQEMESLLASLGGTKGRTNAGERLLQDLWGQSLSAALEAAHIFYAPETGEIRLPQVEEELTATFWRLLTSHCPQRPTSDAETYQAILRVVWKVLRSIRETPTAPFVEDMLSVALRPVRKLQAGVLTPEVCAALYDFDRGVWTPHLTKPQMWTIQLALAETIAALPPDEMEAFWENLQSPNPGMRQAMQLGLTFLRSAHAVPHLLRGLEAITDHDTRAAIVDCLEEIADPRALEVLHRLRRETAQSDWTLSRHLARAIRVIERQNRGNQHRTLLRPTEPPANPEETLLRPAADPLDAVQRRTEEDRATLLRTTSEEGEREKAKGESLSPKTREP